MTDRHRLIEELQTLLVDGATPSRLIQHILSHMSQDSTWEIKQLLQEAFHLPIVRLSPLMLSGEKDFRGSILNKTLLVEMVQRRNEWDTASASSASPPSWLDQIHVRSLE